jgi:hypothetical protein
LRGRHRLGVPRTQTSEIWNEKWKAYDEWLKLLEDTLKKGETGVSRGGDYDSWDLAVTAGLCDARVRMAVEEHGAGRQVARFRWWPRWSVGGVILVMLGGVLSIGAAVDGAWLASSLLGVATLLVVLRMLDSCAASTSAVDRAVKQIAKETE